MKPDLILLHGALGSARQLRPLAQELEDQFNCHLFNFEGHGGRPVGPIYSIELFTENLIDFVVSNDIQDPAVFGYSMGGYVAINAAAEGMDFHKIMTLGTKFNWTPEGAQREIKMLQPEVIEAKIPKYALYQETLHAPEDWKIVMKKTADMMVRLGNTPLLTNDKFSQVEIEVLCCRGSMDEMVTEEETKDAVNKMPKADFFSLEGFHHPIEKINTEVLADEVKAFFLV